MRLAIAFLGLAACASPKPMPYTLPADMGYCAAGIGPRSPDDACDARYTADGMACVLCAVVASCVAKDTMVLCVASCTDAKCGVGKKRR